MTVSWSRGIFDVDVAQVVLARAKDLDFPDPAVVFAVAGGRRSGPCGPLRFERLFERVASVRLLVLGHGFRRPGRNDPTAVLAPFGT